MHDQNCNARRERQGAIPEALGIAPCWFGQALQFWSRIGHCRSRWASRIAFLVTHRALPF
jgi:hypothetical protein